MKRKEFTVNSVGRDFVIGDLHGSLPLLEKFMRHVDFNTDKDRIFSVGDLIDRGADSMGCLNLLDRKWFKCVKANHEELMEDYFNMGPVDSMWSYNGGNWYFNATLPDQAWIERYFLPKVMALPLLITVNLPHNKKFHVIHAEIFSSLGEKITDDDLADPIKFEEISNRNCADGLSLLWGRDMFRDMFIKDITKHDGSLHLSTLKKYGVTDFFNDKLSHIYSGHTPVRVPTTILGQTNLDTWACECDNRSWAGLTAVEPSTNKFWKTNNNGVEEIQPFVL